ncbi:MAG: response regulator [Holophaga sp.]|nr:response regulator [Holophaga sp.]
MPRLLLVDDNPSIHKIAESLLAPTDIELVCVESAKDALNRVAAGEHFDVALVDTSMPLMDGWGLLKELRLHPATASMPIAMMAGVLDTVDPTQIDHPSIQGFLKKPVELRDLGSRVHALLLMPVAIPEPPTEDPSPFSTMPAVKLSDLGTTPAAEEVVDVPADNLADILVLEESDLWPEPALVAGTRTEDLSPFSEIPPEEHLDLEEFDLDSLRNLTSNVPAMVLPAVVEPPVAPMPEPIVEDVVEPLPAPEPEPMPSAFDLFVEAPAELEEADTTPQELPDLGPETEPTFDASSFDSASFDGLDSLSDEALELPPPAMPQEPSLQADPDFLSDLGEVSSPGDVAVIDWSQESQWMPGTMPVTPAFVADHSEAHAEAQVEEPAEGVVQATTEAPAEPDVNLIQPVEPEPAPIPEMAAPAPAHTQEPEALLQALLGNPHLMDQLTKAIVAKLSDQALREIAWEVMPELAERLNRH